MLIPETVADAALVIRMENGLAKQNTRQIVCPPAGPMYLRLVLKRRTRRTSKVVGALGVCETGEI